MLSNLRNLANTKFTKALMILLVGSFALWGVGDVIRSGAHSDVARFDGGEVTLEQWAAKFAELKSRSKAWYGALPPEQKLEVAEAVAMQMVFAEIFASEIKDMGLQVSDDMLTFQIATNPAFQQDSKFSKDKFDAFLKARGLNDASYVEQLRNNLKGMFFERIFSFSTAPEEMLNEVNAAQNKTKIFQLVTVDAKQIKIQYPNFTDQDLQALYEANKESYAEPELRTFSVLKITSRDVKVDQSVSEEQIKAYYDQEKDVLEALEGQKIDMDFNSIKSKYRERILHERAEDEIKKLAEQISSEQATKTLEEIAKQRSLKLSSHKAIAGKGDDLALQEAFALKKGEQGQWLRLNNGDYILVRVDDIKEKSYLEFSAVKDNLVKIAKDQFATNYIEKLSQEASQKLVDSVSLNNFAKEHNLSITKMQLPAYADLNSLSDANYGFVPYTLMVGQVSKPIIDQSGFSILYLESIAEKNSPDKKLDKNIATLLIRDINLEVQNEMKEGLLKQYNVKINTELLRSVISQD